MTPEQITPSVSLDLSRFFEQHPVIETERLLLRPFRMEDAEDVYLYGSDQEVARYSSWPLHRSIEDTNSYLERVSKSFAASESIIFGIQLKEIRRIIGFGGFHHISAANHRMEVGYVLTRAFWGKGYMAEALQAMIRFAFKEMGMHRIGATCDEENTRSICVLEQCGMTLEGTFRDYELRRGKFVGNKVYAILKQPTPSFAKEGEYATRGY